ncbi:MAG TPA: DUF72 domain-containing protein, partial [Polyangiaceae bacterium]|nr:DUF72 domain-containing protein [Polyangiaceae bacterium]
MPRTRAQVTARIRVGISGWSYKPWRGVFYPPELRIKDQLKFASSVFPTVEINGSFYSLQRPQTYRAWFDSTPESFIFSVKGGKFVTHLKRLTNSEQGLSNFFASGVLELEQKLGPILWQLPPTLGFDAARLKAFFEVLPRTFAEAGQLARGHAEWLKGRTSLGPGGNSRIRYALEFRHPSFLCLEAIRLFREYRIAPCVADSAGLFPYTEDLAADLVYVRLHGAEQLYTSGYSPQQLREWSARIRAWHAGRPGPDPHQVETSAKGDGAPRDVFVYFDNDVKVRAPFDALNLERILRGA